jgi:hypothetical protein
MRSRAASAFCVSPVWARNSSSLRAHWAASAALSLGRRRDRELAMSKLSKNAKSASTARNGAEKPEIEEWWA